MGAAVRTFITFHRLLSCAALPTLVGCAASSLGAPTLRTGTNDGFGRLDPDCFNVSPAATVREFQTAFYMSTLSSAWLEGAQSGLTSGLKHQPDDRSRVRFAKDVSHAVVMRQLGVDGSTFRYLPYCTLFRAPQGQVLDVLKQTLPSLGYPLEAVSGTGFSTKFSEREHPAAKWRDRYFVSVVPTLDGETSVHIRRDLWISRQGSPHVQAESNGGNEAWLLQSVFRRGSK